MTETTPVARTIPMHEPIPHLTHLSYFLIGGGQPRGRTVLLHRPKPSPMVENAAAIIQAVVKAHEEKLVREAVHG